MKMWKSEKIFVNSRRHAKENIRITERLFSYLDLEEINNVLEIGCGIGMLSSYLSQKYDMNVFGIDVDHEQIKIARKYLKDNTKLSFSVESATNLPFENYSFDMVLSFNVIHHISDWKNVLKEVHRVLRPFGVFAFSDFAYTAFIKRVFVQIVKNYGLYTVAEIIDYLAGINFQIIHQEKSSTFIFRNHNILFRKSSDLTT